MRLIKAQKNQEMNTGGGVKKFLFSLVLESTGRCKGDNSEILTSLQRRKKKGGLGNPKSLKESSPSVNLWDLRM